MLTCGKTARIATSASAVVVPSRSPIIIGVRRGRSTSVATIVATTRGGWKQGPEQSPSWRSRRQPCVAAHRKTSKCRSKRAERLVGVHRDRTRDGVGNPWYRRCGSRLVSVWGPGQLVYARLRGLHLGSRGVGIDVFGRDNNGESSGPKSPLFTNVGGSSSSSQSPTKVQSSALPKKNVPPPLLGTPPEGGGGGGGLLRFGDGFGSSS